MVANSHKVWLINLTDFLRVRFIYIPDYGKLLFEYIDKIDLLVFDLGFFPYLFIQESYLSCPVFMVCHLLVLSSWEFPRITEEEKYFYLAPFSNSLSSIIIIFSLKV